MYIIQKNLPFREIKNTDFPTGVQLQTCSMCNGRCTMCPYRDSFSHVKHGVMESKLFEKIIDECSNYNVDEFKPFLMNEPLIDERFCSLIGYARKALPDTNIGFSTNGTYLTESVGNGLINFCVDEVWVNFSGNTEETFKKTMHGLDYSLVKSNLIAFSKLVKSKKSELRICISMVETMECLPEIEESKAFWANYGVTVVPIPFNNRGGNSDEQGIKVLSKPIGKRICDKPTTKICILYNGDVVLCPSDWYRTCIIGNVNESSIYDIWNSDERLSIIDKILRCSYDEISLCEKCDFPLLY